MENKRIPAYRDGIEMWTEGEVFTAPGGEVVEILYASPTESKRTYFAELPGVPACAHGDSVQEAIDEAREKRQDLTPLTDEEKREYRIESYKFSVSLFRRLTRACASGTRLWLKERGLSSDATMTLAEMRAAGAGTWADTLESSLQ